MWASTSKDAHRERYRPGVTPRSSRPGLESGGANFLELNERIPERVARRHWSGFVGDGCVMEELGRVGGWRLRVHSWRERRRGEGRVRQFVPAVVDRSSEDQANEVADRTVRLQVLVKRDRVVGEGPKGGIIVDRERGALLWNEPSCRYG